MLKRIAISLSVLLFVWCAWTGAIAALRESKINQIELGMNEADVMALLGSG